MTIDSTHTGPITRSDVVGALGDTDPRSTNAGALREVLGRGSFATIQKHLDAIRLERLVSDTPVSTTDTPPTPPEVEALWSAAYGLALASVRFRLDSVVVQRDALTSAVLTARSDVSALTAQLELSAASGETNAARAGQLETLLSELSVQSAAELASAASAAALELASVRAAAADAEAHLSHALERLRHEAELEALKAQASIQALQSAIDRQSDHLADFKSALRKPS
jgi:hypothetical protein